MSKVARQAQQRAVAGASALMGPRGHALCDNGSFENANASSEWDTTQDPLHLRPLAGQALHVIRSVGHREQTCTNRLLGSILA